ncbi:MAG: preprotein translocase subunit SecG [Parcubacteria group bacterium]|nr:preprotein translocase subunit SecG [Parcubacteria group bacterium]
MELLVSVLPWIQIVLSVLLVAAILLQQTGASLGGAFGGADAGGFHTRRGAERVFFLATIILGILFAITAFVTLLI